ncbi:ankyrin repeat-containing domain protein [Bisporella sp. PMI_857]|nr:ankyrin repeat-containing domain protein [Bisporella sp. PMI_857]
MLSVPLDSKRSRCSRSICAKASKASLRINLTQWGVLWAVEARLEWFWSAQKGFIYPSLSFDKVVRRTSPGFKLLWELQTGQKTDWQLARKELLELFQSGLASPHDLDPEGYTWLEKILWQCWDLEKRDIQINLLRMLVELGTQINTLRLMYRAMSWFEYGPRLGLLRELIRLGFDASNVESPVASKWPAPSYFRLGAKTCAPDPFFVECIAEVLKVCPGFAGMNALQEAILIGSTDEVRQQLVKYSVNEQDNLLCQSALHLAVQRPQHLDLLLEVGVNLNAKDRYGYTPLFYACALDYGELAVKLIAAGASFSLRNTVQGMCCLGIALINRHWDTIVTILSYLHSHPKWQLEFEPYATYVLSL